jgi:hypothetical protein
LALLKQVVFGYQQGKIPPEASAVLANPPTPHVDVAIKKGLLCSGEMKNLNLYGQVVIYR